jgi:hypothetical protein
MVGWLSFLAAYANYLVNKMVLCCVMLFPPLFIILSVLHTHLQIMAGTVVQLVAAVLRKAVTPHPGNISLLKRMVENKSIYFYSCISIKIYNHLICNMRHNVLPLLCTRNLSC